MEEHGYAAESRKTEGTRRDEMKGKGWSR